MLLLQPLDDLIEQLSDTGPMLGGDWEDGFETEPMELDGPASRAMIVHLVDSHQHGTVERSERMRDGLIPRQQSFPPIDDQDEQVCRLEGALTMLKHQLVQRVFACAKHSARIGEGKRNPLPGCGLLNDIARRARHGPHNCPPFADNTVEECRFSDVGATDEDDLRGLSRHLAPTLTA